MHLRRDYGTAAHTKGLTMLLRMPLGKEVKTMKCMHLLKTLLHLTPFYQAGAAATTVIARAIATAS
jgi:hypothetical protein